MTPERKLAKQSIPSTDEAWEDGTLGRDETYVKADDDRERLEAAIDDGLRLKLISIRMKESLISDLKLIAKKEGMGYQPLMKQVLERFVDAELKGYARGRLHEILDEASGEKTHDSAARGRAMAQAEK